MAATAVAEEPAGVRPLRRPGPRRKIVVRGFPGLQFQHQAKALHRARKHKGRG